MDSVNEKNEVHQDPPPKLRRSDWRLMQARVQSVFFKILNDEKHIPTQREIATKLGVSRDTIRNHYENFDYDALLDDTKQYTEAVLQAMAQAAITGNSRDRRLYLEVVHKFRKGVDVNIKRPEELSSDERKEEIRMLITELMAEDETFKDRLAGLLSGEGISTSD